MESNEGNVMGFEARARGGEISGDIGGEHNE